MYAISVGFAVFGAAVCVCGLVASRRPRLGVYGMARSRRSETTPIDTFVPVAASASVTLDLGPQTERDVDIHGVEEESDLKKSPVTPSRKNKVPEADSAR